MNKEVIQYGQQVQEPWGLPIAIYLFAGGLAAGLILSMAVYYLVTKREIELTKKINIAVLALILIIVGSALLLFDLHNIKQFYYLFLHFDTTAPMSWGAWILVLNIGVVGLWLLPEILNFLKLKRIKIFELIFTRQLLACIAIPASISLAAYTGVLLNVMVSKPLWYSPYLPFVFVMSGISTGIVLITGFGPNNELKKNWIRADLVLIVLEIFFIGLYVIDLFNGTTAQVTAVRSLLFSNIGVAFWLLVFFGLLIPIVLEIRELKGKSVPKLAVPVLVLTGGFVLRYLIVYAGH